MSQYFRDIDSALAPDIIVALVSSAMESQHWTILMTNNAKEKLHCSSSSCYEHEVNNNPSDRHDFREELSNEDFYLGQNSGSVSNQFIS